MKLFCLPYAGGSALNIYNKWKFKMSGIEVIPVELKGRGIRYNEQSYANLEEAVDDIFLKIKDEINDGEYAVFGHSMGSLLAYELYYKIHENKLSMPKHMFFSGYVAPQYKLLGPMLHTLPTDQFLKEVVSIGGTQSEILENREICELVVPILRNDFKILELYEYVEKDNLISCGITLLNGDKDNLAYEHIQGWKCHCEASVRISTFKGNHFFINDNIKEITKLIRKTLIKI